ncbi:unnamed protein product [Eruca vesicaria subsp. sativa]|uniref:RRM domain-containing protein n=1 Tax=Eruca vesicaria subsp. sativa TaxID=29727 RepID=A0ABC8IRH6_ERUVS|nr:unnamed protein product [Eruca vesicaria subsp. sativa]
MNRCFLTKGEKTLSVTNLSCVAEIKDIIYFFTDVARVVHVQLLVDSSDKLSQKATDKLHQQEISLAQARNGPSITPYCIDYNVWFEKCLESETRLMIDKEEEGFDETSTVYEEVDQRKKSIFFSNVHRAQRLHHITSFFRFRKDSKDGENVTKGEEFRVRVAINGKGKSLGCGFIEFESADRSKKALLYENSGLNIIADVAEMAPYPIRPRYNHAEEL